jgi:Ca2+-binding EF-hand superfamily protein
VAISIHLRKISHDEHLQRAFQFFDKNESGYIELEELRNALADEVDANSEEVIKAIMHDVDTDKVSIFHIWSEFSMNVCLWFNAIGVLWRIL